MAKIDNIKLKKISELDDALSISENDLLMLTKNQSGNSYVSEKINISDFKKSVLSGISKDIEDAKNSLSSYVTLGTNQTITSNKIFSAISSSQNIPDNSNDSTLATTKFVKIAISTEVNTSTTWHIKNKTSICNSITSNKSVNLIEPYTHFEKILVINSDSTNQYGIFNEWYSDILDLILNSGYCPVLIANNTYYWNIYSRYYADSNSSPDNFSTETYFNTQGMNGKIVDIIGINRIYPSDSSYAYTFNITPIRLSAASSGSTSNTTYPYLSAILSSDSSIQINNNSPYYLSCINFENIFFGEPYSGGTIKTMSSDSDVFNFCVKLTDSSNASKYIWLSSSALSDNSIRNGSSDCWHWTDKYDYLKTPAGSTDNYKEYRNSTSFWYAFSVQNTGADNASTNAYKKHTLKNIPSITVNDFPELSSYNKITFIKNQLYTSYATYCSTYGSVNLIYSNHNKI